MHSLNKWAILPKKTGFNTFIPQNSRVRKMFFPINSNHENISNSTYLKCLLEILSILAKLAK